MQELHAVKNNNGNERILSTNEFPVVGIGASAGGLEAFTKFLKAIPVDSGMAYVLVQHLDPDHHSVLPSLLQKVTSIPVHEISDEVKVEPDNIYILPSNKMLVANDGILELTPRPPKRKNEPNLPIDLFFSSLAAVHQSHAIGIVLSGTQSDGTAGLRAIKEHGGITLAQDEASAAFDGMPQSAALAGVVDYIMPPERMPLKLLQIVQELYYQNNNPSDEDEELIKQILVILSIRKGTDFTYYKRPTIRRRLLRRMVISKTGTLSSYLAYLKANEAEQDALYLDLMISVTSFFRDDKVFDALCASALQELVNNLPEQGPIRVWVAGCSTGQEAYSIAICLSELIGPSQRTVQVFATDISEQAIATARVGQYSKKEVAGVVAHRLKDFFTENDNGFRINKKIREMCIFATHNFLKDPPFGKIDLVSCRNVLIYMEPYLQKKAFAIFHYALNPKGYLLLGKAESTNGVPLLFAGKNKPDKLYIRKDGPGSYMHVASPRREQHLYDANAEIKKPSHEFDLPKFINDAILTNYGNAGVVINEYMEIVQYLGQTNDYMEQTSGKPTFNLLKLAKAELSFELRTVIQQSKAAQKPARKEGIAIEIAGIQKTLTIDVFPITGIRDRGYLILFNAMTLPVQTKLNSTGLSPGNEDGRIIQLEQELARNKIEMRSLSSEMEEENEYHQRANEELLSSSEEMQSLNEELESSKEELQSTNDELTFLNLEQNNLNDLLQAASATQIILQKKMEAQALLTENLLMNAPGFICTMTGPDHVYEMVNSRYQQLFGKRKLKGLPILIALPELEGQGIDNLLNNVYATGVPYVGIELEVIVARDEHLLPEERYFNFSFQPMYNEHKEIYSILVFGYEVTEQVVARDKIAAIHTAHAKELEEKVLMRTNELSISNEALVRNNESLVSMNNELESFTYVSSHDLQEPLRKIQLFAGRILAEDYAQLSEGGKAHFQRINNAAGKMQKLIQDLLSYAQTSLSERGNEKTSLNRIVAKVMADLADKILEKKAVIEVGELCEVFINPLQFKQVFTNLFRNSLRFCRENIPPHITISSITMEGSQFKGAAENGALDALSSKKSYCCITFRDNGIGFDPQFSNKIFEVFERLHNSDLNGGTGIGLSIVRKIVSQHEGIITASGEIDRGAVFNIYIPAY